MAPAAVPLATAKGSLKRIFVVCNSWGRFRLGHRPIGHLAGGTCARLFDSVIFGDLSRGTNWCDCSCSVALLSQTIACAGFAWAMAGKTTASLWQTFSKCNPRRDASPLESVIDLSKFGGALLLTSAMAVPEENYRPLNDEEDNNSQPGESVHTIDEDSTTRSEPVDEKYVAPGDERKPKWLGAYRRAIHGTQYRRESMTMYQEQAQLAIDMLIDHLTSIGVPYNAIQVAAYGCEDWAGESPSMDPDARIRYFYRCMTHAAPDCLVYYFGYSGPDGEWAFDWVDGDKTRSFLVHPDHLEPLPDEKGGGPPGMRLVVSDSPFTANVWMQPNPRHMGLAAWTNEAMAGSEEGPLLARWVTGHWVSRDPPQGTIAFPLPPDMGLRIMPTYVPLFWGVLPETETAAVGRLWELQEFVGACTRKERRADSNYEVMVRGLVHIIVVLMDTFGTVCQEALLMRCIWLLHSMVLMSPAERWLGAMQLALGLILDLLQARPGASIQLMAAALDFAGACIGRCARVRLVCCHGRDTRALIRAFAVSNLGGAPECGKRLPLHAGSEKVEPVAGAAAARLLAQLMAHEPPDVEDLGDREVLSALQMVLLKDWTKVYSSDRDLLACSEITRAVAEALCLASLRCQPVKWRLLRTLASTPAFLKVLDTADAPTSTQILALIRSLAVAEPEEVELGRAQTERLAAGGGGAAEDSAEPAADDDESASEDDESASDVGEAAADNGESESKLQTGVATTRNGKSRRDSSLLEEAPPPPLPQGTDEAIIQALSKFPHDPKVQRWGLAALGALVARRFPITTEAGTGAGTCVVWALGTDSLGHSCHVEQEALFLAHELLLRNEGGRIRLNQRELRTAELVSNAVKRVASTDCRAPPEVAMEVLCWGIKVLGLIAASKGGPAIVAPFIQTIIDAILAPGCTESTALAGCSTLSIVVAGCKPAKEAIQKDRVRLLKSLQLRARTLPQAQRIRMSQWVQVLVESIGGYKPPVLDDEPNKEAKPSGDDSDEDDEVFPYDLEKGKKGNR